MSQWEMGKVGMKGVSGEWLFPVKFQLQSSVLTKLAFIYRTYKISIFDKRQIQSVKLNPGPGDE
jgi:hypothetical protein